MGPVLFSIFIRPLYDLETLTTYADDNYIKSENRSLDVALKEIKLKIEGVTKWITKSGLKINEKKTDLCIFHRRAQEKRTIIINGTQIESSDHINILCITFDSNMKWDLQYDNVIKEANQTANPCLTT